MGVTSFVGVMALCGNCDLEWGELATMLELDQQSVSQIGLPKVTDAKKSDMGKRMGPIDEFCCHHVSFFS